MTDTLPLAFPCRPSPAPHTPAERTGSARGRVLRAWVVALIPLLLVVPPGIALVLGLLERDLQAVTLGELALGACPAVCTAAALVASVAVHRTGRPERAAAWSWAVVALLAAAVLPAIVRLVTPLTQALADAAIR